MTKVVEKEVDYTYLNGKYPLEDEDYIRVQWYPGVRSFYGIINDNPGAQLSLEPKELLKLLTKCSAGFAEARKERKRKWRLQNASSNS
jgi:hypothetical protein